VGNVNSVGVSQPYARAVGAGDKRPTGAIRLLLCVRRRRII
jgi:hypothetical protein